MYIPLTKRKKMMRDAKYKRVGAGHLGDKDNEGYYVSVAEVEHRLTRKIGWIATICKGGGWCAIKHYATTKVFENERDAIVEGEALLKTRGD